MRLVECLRIQLICTFGPWGEETLALLRFCKKAVMQMLTGSGSGPFLLHITIFWGDIFSRKSAEYHSIRTLTHSLSDPLVQRLFVESLQNIICNFRLFKLIDLGFSMNLKTWIGPKFHKIKSSQGNPPPPPKKIFLFLIFCDFSKDLSNPFHFLNNF